MTSLRRSYPVLRRDAFLQGRTPAGIDVLWLTADGREMRDADWADPERRTLGVLFDGTDLSAETLLILFSAAAQPIEFLLPAHGDGTGWQVLADTAASAHPGRYAAGTTFELIAHSAAVLKLLPPDR